MRSTGELWETLYIDKIGLVVLDHPDEVEVYVDERMGPPSLSGYKLYQVEEKHLPVSVTDQYGTDLLPVVAEWDDQYTPLSETGKIPGPHRRCRKSPLIPDKLIRRKLFLYLYGWIFPTDASINASISQSDEITMFRLR